VIEAAPAPRRATRTTIVAIALLAPLAVSGALLLFREQLFTPNAALILVLPVLAAAIVGGRAGGALSAITAALCFDFFFTRPYYSFTISRRHDVETMLVLLAVGLVVGEIVRRARRSGLLANVRGREVDQIRRVAELAAGGGPDGRLITIVEREVVDLLHARGIRFERPPYATVLPRLGHGVVTIPPGGDATPDRPHGPRNETEIPVTGHGRELGRLVVVLPRDTTGADLPPDDRALALALVDQLGATLSQV
jgi:hypothetical protein